MTSIEDVDIEVEFETLKKCADGCGKIMINEDDMTNVMIETFELLRVLGLIEYMLIHDELTLRYNALVRIK